MTGSELTFPLTPRRRVIGLSFGGLNSTRRGAGFDVAGSRPYVPGDDVRRIDWNASARLSSAHAADEFVLRERHAEEAPRVVVLADRRPSMSLFPAHLPWLHKQEALEAAVRFIAGSTLAARGLSGYLDYAEGGEDPFWLPPRSEHESWRPEDRRVFRAPEDNVDRGLRYLTHLRPTLPSGTFLFVLSDFLVPPGEETWLAALERRWDLVPVVFQDELWERSFPEVSGAVVPLADPGGGRVRPVRLTRAEAAERREANERRWADLREAFRLLDLEPVLVGSHDPASILSAFLVWAEQRQYSRSRPS
jgi:uncharacterized protein (DUF58 family)